MLCWHLDDCYTSISQNRLLVSTETTPPFDPLPDFIFYTGCGNISSQRRVTPSPHLRLKPYALIKLKLPNGFDSNNVGFKRSDYRLK